MQRHELTLPDLGIDEGPIAVSLWLVRRGSRVIEGDPLVEILAGSVIVDLPSPADGVLVEALVAEDDVVQVGQPLAVIHSDAETTTPDSDKLRQ